MPTPKTEITAEAIQKIIAEKKPTSLTGVAHALGHRGTVSGTVAARIRGLVPDVADLLAANKPAKDATGGETSTAKPKVAKKAAKVAAKPAAGDKPAGKGAYPIPDCVPYRRSSGYAQVWSILHAFKSTGISKNDLTAKYKAWSGKPDKNCGFDVHVVISPKEDGSSHRSAAKASGSYWVERTGAFLKLRLVGEKK